MDFNFNVVLHSFDGTALTENYTQPDGSALPVMEGGKPKSLTAFAASRHALVTDLSIDHNDGVDKFARVELALRLLTGFREKRPVDVTDEEKVMLRKRVQAAWGSLIVHAFCRFLDGKEQIAPFGESNKVVSIGAAG